MPADAQRGDINGAQILIVDDSSTDRMVIGNMLADFEILTACDGIEALR
jgi:putative two-component system response regulator